MIYLGKSRLGNVSFHKKSFKKEIILIWPIHVCHIIHIEEIKSRPLILKENVLINAIRVVTRFSRPTRVSKMILNQITHLKMQQLVFRELMNQARIYRASNMFLDNLI